VATHHINRILSNAIPYEFATSQPGVQQLTTGSAVRVPGQTPAAGGRCPAPAARAGLATTTPQGPSTASNTQRAGAPCDGPPLPSPSAPGVAAGSLSGSADKRIWSELTGRTTLLATRVGGYLYFEHKSWSEYDRLTKT
jgi:hypothetical protein